MKSMFLILLLVVLVVTENINYKPGDINLILTVPHNGYDRSEDIPIRQPGCKNSAKVCRFPGRSRCDEGKICRVVVDGDGYTQTIGKYVHTAFKKLTGRTPHLIISNLHRSRMDPNREIAEAAQGNQAAMAAYEEFHGAIREAKKTFGREPGLLIDIHGQAHKKNRTEIGYLIKPKALNLGNYTNSKLSIKALVMRKKDTVEEFIWGSRSLGALFEDAGYKAVPSPNKTSPGKDKYFNGGYITSTHGSWYGGLVDAIQLEIPGEIRNNGGKSLRKHFSSNLARILATFFAENYEELEFK